MGITNYGDLARGYEGQIARTEDYTVRSGFNADTKIIPFGRVVVRGTGSSGTDVALALPSATGQEFMGIAVKTDVHEKNEKTVDANGDLGYELKRPMGRIVEGLFYGYVEEAVTTTDTVYFRHTLNGTPGAYERIGRYRNDADTAKCDAAPRLKFREAAGPGLVLMEIIKG
jgi:hypothetical protein